MHIVPKRRKTLQLSHVPNIAIVPTASRKRKGEDYEPKEAKRISVDTRTHVLDLPSDVAELILSYLDCRSIGACAAVCRSWNSLDYNFIFFNLCRTAEFLPEDTQFNSCARYISMYRETSMERLAPFTRYLQKDDIPDMLNRFGSDVSMTDGLLEPLEGIQLSSAPVREVALVRAKRMRSCSMDVDDETSDSAAAAPAVQQHWFQQQYPQFAQLCEQQMVFAAAVPFSCRVWPSKMAL
eukprot:TRINITY_DN10177_c0_g1_i1.p1 TRINITY_DN10177_c0_g1~~TRINITY_DN10177_c0_g1_i1.p1  ORF type:complete len:238 (+),score=36.02 TRINITY_DN10177_c0_g1_i1:68-781(+)